MSYLLIAVTLAATAIAVVMCAIVIRMLRDERRRSDARVEALLAAAEPPGVPSVEEPPRLARNAVAARSENRVPPSLDGFGDPSSQAGTSPVPGVEGLFAERATSSPWPRRLGGAGAAAALLLVAAFVWGWADRGGAGGGHAATAATAAAPLELLSLTHAPAGAGLTITGLVQNPPGGAALTDVTAVALLFASDGAFIASGRAPLDFKRLDPGSESPFIVKVPAAKRVARYRVSFRQPDGAVIAHVDRRNGPPVARKD